MARNPFRAIAKALNPIPQTTLRGSIETPAAIDAAMVAQGMDSSAQLGPGRPINPAWGYSTRPRAMDYPVGVNIAAGNSRAQWGRTSYDTLKGIIEAYDIARACIDHKISELQSMEPMFSPVDGYTGDAKDALDVARLALEFPDRDLPYLSWLSKWLEGCYRYDAGMLYRRRNRAGEIIGLDIIDGTTVTPKVDQYGRKPQPPAVAFQQIIKGLPTVDFTTDDLIPTIFRPQTDSPFGLAPIESVLLTANTDLRFQKHFLDLFTDGTVPHGLVELPGDISTPDQVAEWQDYWDALMMGDQAMLRRLRAVPMGTKLTETRPATFDTAFAEYLASRTASAFGVLPQDLGLNHDINRANGETQTDIQFRVNTLPWVRFVEGVLTRYLRYDLGLPVQVKLDTGRDVVDRVAEAQAWKIGTEGGAVSVDEWRQEVYGLPIDNERPMPRFVMNPRTGPAPLRSILAIAGPTDSETGAPSDALPLDTTPFDGAGALIPDKTPGGTQFKRAPIDPDDPAHPELEHPVPGSEVLGTTVSSKPLITDPAQGRQVEAQQAANDPMQLALVKEATAGVTSATGISGSPLAGADDEDEDEDKIVDLTPSDEEVAKAAELASFARFSKARIAKGKWRDFTFTSVDPITARLLNGQARELVELGKDGGR
jgi:phage portal protein BeeE